MPVLHSRRRLEARPPQRPHELPRALGVEVRGGGVPNRHVVQEDVARLPLHTARSQWQQEQTTPGVCLGDHREGRHTRQRSRLPLLGVHPRGRAVPRPVRARQQSRWPHVLGHVVDEHGSTDEEGWPQQRSTSTYIQSSPSGGRGSRISPMPSRSGYRASCRTQQAP